jgi:hypothetical protein
MKLYQFDLIKKKKSMFLNELKLLPLLTLNIGIDNSER